MKWRVDVHTLVAVLLCCCFQSGFSQDPTDTYHGCYFDNHQRALSDLITCDEVSDVCHLSCGKEHRYCESMDMMTIDLCRDICRRRNLRYYALEAGNQCFCGGALSDPFHYGSAAGVPSGSCSHPCTGDNNTTCGGEFQMQVYEFQDPVPGSDCFHPGFVRNSYISHFDNLPAGVTLSYLCQPLHRIIGDAQVTCQPDRSWQPNMRPICNYTGVIEEPTTESVTTMQNLTTIQTTTAAKPLTTITDFLPYIIGGSALLLLILVVCLVGICVCGRRRRSGNAGQDISLKPEPAPVTFINTGFVAGDDADAKVEMPDILSSSANGKSSSPPPANVYNSRMSTFSEEPIYLNGEAAHVSVYGHVNETEPLSPDDPPSPIYLNAEAALPDNEQSPSTDTPDGNTGYTKRYSATTDRPYPKRGVSSEDPGAAYATGNRRAKKNGTGTKDLVGWSRPSSLYQRTEFDDEDDGESNEDNTSVEPNALSAAIYAQIDKSRKSDSRETLNSEVSGNSFFADPAKSSATRL
ncbi:uncharacterized protein LOC119729251 [Patiria miniata]|uniref:WSC domain-containing protein n=1 Tax=Patiria miniata TaxID=46514 RepID=A0A914A1N8_PATMI|nr:uncharacterized protein LOC119729251 [Patiria miniata]